MPAYAGAATFRQATRGDFMSLASGASRGNRFRFRGEIGLACLDLLAVYGIVLLALQLRFHGEAPLEHSYLYLVLMPLLIVWRLIMVRAFGLYDFRHRLVFVEHVFAAIGAAVAGIAGGYVILALVQLYYLPWTQLSRLVAVIDMGLMCGWLIVSRGIVLFLLRSVGYSIRVMLVGPRETCDSLAHEIRDHAPRAVQVLEPIVLEESPSQAVQTLIHRMHATGPERIDQVILVELSLTQQDLRDLLATCDEKAAECYVLPTLNYPVLASRDVFSIAGLPLVPLSPRYQTSLYRVVKRLMDVVIAALLLILSSPLAVMAAWLTRLSSHGPAFFAQERVGMRGAMFRLYKLRTMVADAEAETGPALAIRSDPRVTRLGGVLRKFRVDEIPQLWNVLRGEMSLVGPRPERKEFVEQFIKENPLYERRLLVKPGLTGLAQIHGRYDTAYAHKLRYDLIYVNTVSLLVDLRILIATVRIVLTGHGAV